MSEIDENADEIAQLKADAAKARADVFDWIRVANERARLIEERDSLLREAIADFRQNVKQPTKAADWAFKWVNRFIEAVEK